LPRPHKNEPKARLHLELPERVRRRLEQLRVLSEADTITEVVRRALAVYDVLVTAVKVRKERVFLRADDGTEREVLLP
jgi:hypothetical protein